MEKISKSLSAQTLRIFWRSATKYRAAAFGSVLAAILATSVNLIKPFFYRQLFDQLSIANPDSSQVLFGIVWMILLISIIGWVCWRVSAFIDNFWSTRVISDLLNRCYAYLQDHSYNFFSESFSGSLVRKVNRFSRAYEVISEQVIWNIVPTIVTIVVAVVVLWQRFWVLGVLILIWTVVFIGLNYWFTTFKMKLDLAHADADSRASGHLADTVTNNLNLKLFGGSKKEFETYSTLTDEMYVLGKRSYDFEAIAGAVQGAMMIALEVGVLWLAIKYYQQGKLTIGDFALLQAYLIQIFDNIWGVSRYIRKIYQGLADANEMTEILLTEHEIVDSPDARSLKVTRGDIEFENVNFAYKQDQDVLNDFALKVDSGQKIALIGPSGGGKSTVVKLLLRLYDVNIGKIKIDGQIINEVTQDSLREAISVVPQEPLLFHRSLVENIRYAKPKATNKEVFEAAKAANCDEFIKAFPDGYDTLVGERGVKLSGGERQRVAIARAILKNAPILVLDEATSSLDSSSERLIQDSLRTLMKGKTAIVIAHRLSTIMQMDRIYVLENGSVVEQGSHDELLKVENGTYQKLWQIQVGGYQAAPGHS